MLIVDNSDRAYYFVNTQSYLSKFIEQKKWCVTGNRDYVIYYYIYQTEIIINDFADKKNITSSIYTNKNAFNLSPA